MLAIAPCVPAGVSVTVRIVAIVIIVAIVAAVVVVVAFSVVAFLSSPATRHYGRAGGNLCSKP